MQNRHLIRTAGVDDTPSLAFLRQERAVLLRQSDPRLLTTAPLPEFDTLFTAPNCRVLAGIATDTDQLAGYAVGWLAPVPTLPLPPQTAWVVELTLDAHRYHGGLGRDLLHDLAVGFKAAGCTRALMHVPRYHAVEQAFWRGLGAVEVNSTAADPLTRLPDHPAQVWMTLTL